MLLEDFDHGVAVAAMSGGWNLLFWKSLRAESANMSVLRYSPWFHCDALQRDACLQLFGQRAP